MMLLLLRTSSILVCLAAVSAAPALVWRQNKNEETTVHSSNEVNAKDLLRKLSGKAVVFLVGRDTDGGREALSGRLNELTSVAATPASEAHHHVTGMHSASAMSAATKGVGITLEDFIDLQRDPNSNVEFSAKELKQRIQKLKKIDSAQLVLVDVAPEFDSQLLDETVTSTIRDTNFDTVVLSAVRGVEEVKRERVLMAKQKFQMQQKVGEQQQTFNRNRRRLEENVAQDGNNNNNNADLAGIYYVSLTPNILAGLLYFFLFTAITWIAVGCMGMISGQDTYVTKMPSIGREA
jgi:hypothetical protein